MRMTWKIGRILGVDIGLHYSWVIIEAWILFALAAQLHANYPDWSSASLWAGAFLTALLFFLGLLGHELAHAVVGNRRGVGVRSVTLFALGGVAQADRESPNASTEFWIAIAGPAASCVIGAGCLGAAYGLGWEPWTRPSSPAVSIPVLLGIINLWLAVFNMLPAYPLDGGRVLRAGIWGVSGSAEFSLRAAAQTSRVLAMALMGIGAIRFLATGSAAWLWMSFIGWFVLSAAGSIYDEARVTQALSGVRVRDVVHGCPEVDRNMNLREFIFRHIVPDENACAFVNGADGSPGVVSAREISDIPRPQWPYHTVGDIMRPLGEDEIVGPDALVIDALEQMGRENVTQLAVQSGGQLEGMISRADVAAFLVSRTEGAQEEMAEPRP